MSTDPAGASARVPGRWVAVVCGAFVTSVLIVAGVLLAAAGWQGESIVGFLTGIAAVAALLCGALAKMIDLDTKQDQQSAVLARITDQTNGALDARIEKAIAAALAARDQQGG